MNHLQTFIILNLVLRISNIEAFTLSSPLRYRADGTFKIVQFTDLHFGSREIEDSLSITVMETVLDTEKPDLVIMTVSSSNQRSLTFTRATV
jgi:hypothetical protein